MEERWEKRSDPEFSSYASYDGPGAGIAEAMRVTPCCGACFVDLSAAVTAGGKLTERMSVLYGFKEGFCYIGHVDSCSSFSTHSPYTIVNGMWCIYQTRLVDIVRWKRGEVLDPPHPDPVYFKDDTNSVMRITLDNLGIREIERLPHHPSYSSSNVEALGFVVEKLSTLRDYTACFKDDLLPL